MRQDPQYYVTYAALRSDGVWRLVSYPYYAKYAKKGDNTKFAYLDVNLKALVASGRGKNMIQKNIFFDDEDPDCYIYIISEIYNNSTD